MKTFYMILFTIVLVALSYFTFMKPIYKECRAHGFSKLYCFGQISR